MAVLVDAGEGRTTLVKGAPERVLRMCGGIEYQHWHDRAEAMARQGLRVLALAERQEAGQNGICIEQPCACALRQAATISAWPFCSNLG